MANHLTITTFIVFFTSLATLVGCAGKNDTSSDAATADAASPDKSCTRAALRSAVDDYFDALVAHDASQLKLAPKVKFTENGKAIKVGAGLWTNAGELKFKRSALDTETCNSVTESVLSEDGTDIIVGLRLKLEGEDIAEIESIVVHKGDYISSPAGLLNTMDDDWESTLPKSDRPTRDELIAVVDKYFIGFPESVCGYPDDCERSENGLVTGVCSFAQTCSDAGVGMGSRSLEPRHYVLDVEAGIAVGFTLFVGNTIPGTYSDFHMFKYRDGNVHSIHATLATASQSGWD